MRCPRRVLEMISIMCKFAQQFELFWHRVNIYICLWLVLMYYLYFVSEDTFSENYVVACDIVNSTIVFNSV
jgi:hypothetical protein